MTKVMKELAYFWITGWFFTSSLLSHLFLVSQCIPQYLTTKARSEPKGMRQRMMKKVI